MRLKRRLPHKALFSDADWRFLFGFPLDKVLTVALWRRMALANLIAAAGGFGISFLILPYDVGWFLTVLVLTAVALKRHLASSRHFLRQFCSDGVAGPLP